MHAAAADSDGIDTPGCEQKGKGTHLGDADEGHGGVQDAAVAEPDLEAARSFRQPLQDLRHSLEGLGFRQERLRWRLATGSY